MDHAPPAAMDCTTEAGTCQCQPAGCPHCGAGQPSEAALRHRRNLAELGEIGMDLARQVRVQMRHTGVVTNQGSQMFERLSRAVRRAHALEAKIEAESLKSAEQRAAEQARLDVARLRASLRDIPPGQPGQTRQVDQAAAAPAGRADPRERSDLLDDLDDHEDLFDDLDDEPDDEDFDDAASVGDVIADVHRPLFKARRTLASWIDRPAADKATANEPAAPNPSSKSSAPARPASGVGGDPRLAAAMAPAAVPPALAWPPQIAHGPPR
jgi:hypothetical protein